MEISQADAELARRALDRQRKGDRPSRDELAALRRVEKAREEIARWKYYGSIPQKHWRLMSGRQTKVLHEQAASYGIPVAAPTIDLSALARWVHDFLAANARKLSAPSGGGDGDDDVLGGGNSPQLERLRRYKADLARLDLHARRGNLIARDQVRTAHTRMAQVLRHAGEQLQRQFGDDAVAVLDEALNAIEREAATLGDAEAQASNEGPPVDGDDAHTLEG